MHVRDVRVKVSKRSSMEKALLQCVGLQRSATAATPGATRKREKIVARRLAVGLHNGRALSSRKAEADGFFRVDLKRCDGDVLAADADDAGLVLEGYAKHALCALVVVLE